MSRLRDEPAFPVSKIKKSRRYDGEMSRTPYKVGGLTKYQHTVIEMAKAARISGGANVVKQAVIDADRIWDALEKKAAGE